MHAGSRRRSLELSSFKEEINFDALCVPLGLAWNEVVARWACCFAELKTL